MNAIEMIGLTKKFGNLTAVDSLNLTVSEGVSFGFLGPNGAGKTTTMRMLVGQLRPTSGIVKTWGLDPFTEGIEAKKYFGFVPSFYSFYDSLSARENLDFLASLSQVPRNERKKRIDELLDFFDLSERADSKVGEFSHGMMQRLAIAQALLAHPRLLILDEPTVGLDPKGQHEIREFIKSISREGVTIFISSHILSEVEDMCNSVGIIDKGRLIRVGSLENLKAELSSRQGLEIRIEGESLQQSLNRIEKVEGVLGLKADGNTISVKVSSRDITPLVVATIVGSGGKITSVDEIVPTLEDVYLKLTE